MLKTLMHSFLLRAALFIDEHRVWLVSKWFLFPFPPDKSRKGIYCEKLVRFLGQKLPKVWGPLLTEFLGVNTQFLHGASGDLSATVAVFLPSTVPTAASAPLSFCSGKL